MRDLCAALVIFAACGGGESVDIVGKSPEAQADDIAAALCSYEADCGDVDIDCTFNQTTMTTECTGTIMTVTYDACYADERADIFGDLSQCNFTAAQEQQLQNCINASLDQPCVTQAELDAYVAKLEAGDESAELRPEPPACDGIDALFESCPQ
jgi:hypothetical protein